MLAAVLLATLASTGDPPVSTFTSPSGAWTLTVTRREKTWNGIAELVLVRDGVQAWRAEHALGLREACVSDDGRVAGFGYTGDAVAEYPSPVPPPDWPRGNVLRIFVLDAKGALALDAAFPREWSSMPHAPREPFVLGAFLIEDLRRFVVRIEDEDGNRLAESWWAFDLDTGAALPRVRPKLVLGHDRSVRGLLAARHVPRTPLVVLHWRTYDEETHAVGSKFQLVDTDVREVWTLDRPNDLDSLGQQERNALGERGNVVATGDNAFELRLVGDAALVSFRVERADDSWSVTETARRPDPDAKPAKKPKPRAR
jgi:hypothetical protein